MKPEDTLANAIAAGAFGLAAFHLQNALITSLVAKGHLTMKEAATVFEGAIHEADILNPNPPQGELSSYARQILSGALQGWKPQTH